MRPYPAAVTVALAQLFLAATLAFAQEPVAIRPTHVSPAVDSSTRADSAAVVAEPRANCWRAQRRPPCQGFFLTEVGLDVPVRTTLRGAPTGLRKPDMRFLWSAGFMGTRGRHSHGGLASLIGEDAGAGRLPWMFEYRYRNWLNRSAAFDAGIGYTSSTLWHPGRGAFVSARGASMLLAFTPSRWIGVSLRYDATRGGGLSQRVLFVGAQSTRGSEYLIKYTALALFRAALGAIGVEVEE